MYHIVLYDAEHVHINLSMSEAAEVCLRFSFNMKVCRMKEVKYFAPYSDLFSENITITFLLLLSEREREEMSVAEQNEMEGQGLLIKITC